MYTEINTKLKIYISNWLLFMFFLVAIMIVVGGLTRLTDSGLSITEWEFFKGFFPPITLIFGQFGECSSKKPFQKS